MVRIAQAAALLLLLFLANQAQGRPVKSTRVSHVEEDDRNDHENHDDRYDEYYDEDELEGSEDFDDYHDELYELENEEPFSDRKALKGARTLKHRIRSRNGKDLHGSRQLSSKGKGGGYYSRSFSRSFLDPDIEPRPFINCIPVPPFSRSHSKGRSGKGKGGKGKGNRRRSRRYRSKGSRRNLQESNRNLRHRGRGRGKGGGKGSSSRSHNGGRNGRGRGRWKKLPYCPLPTFAPTFLPTVTPFPTFTPLPTITPFPSFTPVPTETMENEPSTAPSIGPSIAPSVSKQPSGAPSTSDAPSVSKQPSGAPSSNTAGPTSRTVSARLTYGFFDTTTIREPTTAEYAGLVTETERFYSDIIRAAYPSTFTSFTMSNIVNTFDATQGTAGFPVIRDFDATVTFTSDNANTPSAAVIFALMEAANYDNYIMSYVWNALPANGIFFDTNRVTFAARGG